MTPAITVSAFNLDTLARTDYPSMGKAARACGVDLFTVRKHLKADQAFNGWYWCPVDAADAKTGHVEYLSRRWKAEGKPLTGKRERKALVSLRIDSHTVILVPPEKATPEYAEQYRQKLLKNSLKY